MGNDIGNGRSGCFRCYFTWHPRTSDPKVCPRCKSRLWDVPVLRRVERGGGLGIKEIIEPKRVEMQKALRDNRAVLVSVFGSVGRGTATKKSDIDLIIALEPGATVWDHVGVVQALEDVFGRKVDAPTADALHWAIRPQVMFEAVPA